MEEIDLWRCESKIHRPGWKAGDRADLQSESKAINCRIQRRWVFCFLRPTHIMKGNALLKVQWFRASLLAQWLRICLVMQGTWVQSLVWEDPTCCTATKLCTTTIELVLWRLRVAITEPHPPRAGALQLEKQPQWEALTLQLQPSPHFLQLEKAFA